MSLSELDAAVGKFLIEIYQKREHPETGQSPAARWLGQGWLPRMPESLDELNLLLLTVATPRKVQRDGIHLFGLRYFAITLTAYVAEEVTVRYDPRDLAEIRVYHRGEYVCRAVSAEIAAATISIKDLQAARNTRRRELREHLTARRTLADLLARPDPPAPATAAGKPAGTSAEAPAAKIKLYRED